MKAICLTCFVLIFVDVVWGELPDPKNVTLDTINTNYVLKWDWDPYQESENSCNSTFTAQYIAKFKTTGSKSKQKWMSVCLSTPEHYCDFTSVDLHYLGVWILRVRSQCGQNVSDWVSVEFCPDKDALLGPPSEVHVTDINGLLQVAIYDPLSSKNTSMKKVVDNMFYHVQYWEKDLPSQIKKLLTDNNLVVISNVEKRTWYCVRVQTQEKYYSKTSAYSPIYCIYIDGPIPDWQIVLYFLGSMVLCFLLVMLISTCHLWLLRFIKNIFYPLIPLPAHIHEYLCDKDGSDMPVLLSMNLEEEEICCDKVQVLISDPVVTEDSGVILEIHAQPWTSEHGGRMSSRQNSSDSGVYSTEGSSNLMPNEHIELKMDKTGGKNLNTELDEGILGDIV